MVSGNGSFFRYSFCGPIAAMIVTGGFFVLTGMASTRGPRHEMIRKKESRASELVAELPARRGLKAMIDTTFQHSSTAQWTALHKIVSYAIFQFFANSHISGLFCSDLNVEP